jgi:hypothetical protein
MLGGHRPVTRSWILTELWPFSTLENSLFSLPLFYYQAQRIVEHVVLRTALVTLGQYETVRTNMIETGLMPKKLPQSIC